MNLKEALLDGAQQLQSAGIADANTDAWLLLEWVSGVSRAVYFMDPERALTKEEETAYREALRRRLERIPLQHITGEQEFMGLTFRVNRHVLIPRQDTECLVEEALTHYKRGMRVLDLCTGSGCIAISMERLGAGEGAEPGQFTGADLSPEALAVARDNAGRLGAEVTFVESDLFGQIDGTFDMIVSNPPYIRTSVIEELEKEVRCHDPWMALDGKEDGLFFYREIIAGAREHLNDGGWLMFEIGHDQRADVMSLMKAAGYREITARKDLAGLDRVVFGRYYILDESL